MSALWVDVISHIHRFVTSTIYRVNFIFRICGVYLHFALDIHSLGIGHVSYSYLLRLALLSGVIYPHLVANSSYRLHELYSIAIYSF